MLRVVQGLAVGLAGLAASYAVLIVMLGREGIGPGDSLSPLGVALPVAAGAFAVTLCARGDQRRILGSLLLWLALVGANAALNARFGQGQAGLVEPLGAALAVHLLAAAATRVRRRRAAPSADGY